MTLALHQDFHVQKLNIGREQAPLVVIDNLVADADDLVEVAASKVFSDVTSYYPGVRAKVPLTYQQFVREQLRGELAADFGLDGSRLRFTGCNFSLVTTSPEKLNYLQRIPHIDSLKGNELAFVHYLFKADLGGTAFYRHRKTGFEYIDRARREYYRYVEDEKDGPDDRPPYQYISGDTALYEQIDRQAGVFNRMLLYRRNSLHSGAMARDFVPDPNPRTGRLTINGFLA
jgi:hypothetical protein